MARATSVQPPEFRSTPSAACHHVGDRRIRHVFRRRADGRDLPTRDLAASVIQPGDPDGPAYIVYDNYHTLLEWNRSDYFATAVGTLADRIGYP